MIAAAFCITSDLSPTAPHNSCPIAHTKTSAKAVHTGNALLSTGKWRHLVPQ